MVRFSKFTPKKKIWEVWKVYFQTNLEKNFVLVLACEIFVKKIISDYWRLMNYKKLIFFTFDSQ